MFNYLAFICGGIAERGATPATDGAEIAQKCLRQLEETGNPEQFPPRLLILLTSSAYSDEGQITEMLTSIRQTVAHYKSRIFSDVESESREVPLIGSSVDAVFFNRQVYERGALLVCLASRLVEAEVLVSHDVRHYHEAAIDDLLNRLEPSYLTPESSSRKPLPDRLMLTFFPNIGRHDQRAAYLAPELHRLLREKARTRIPIVGGVSSRPGFQFVGEAVYHDELVAARISTGSPFSSSFGHGLTETTTDLRVKMLADDGRTVLAFDQPGSPAEILGLKDRADFALLGELSLNHDPLVTAAHVTADGQSVTLLRQIREGALFRRLEITDSMHLRREAQRMFVQSLHWWMVERPIGCLAIHSASRHGIGPTFQDFAADAEEAIKSINAAQPLPEQDLYFGGFFDGEAGADESGRFLFGNWGIATLCFSDEMDEMRARTPAHTGFKAISAIAPSLTSIFLLREALKDSLKVIFETGFPGAMISLVTRDQDDEWLIAREGVGSRFEKIVEVTKRPMTQEDILAIVARNGQPEFIPDSAQDTRCDQETTRISGIISQYVLPLFDRGRHLIAVLQFDLGDLRRRQTGLFPAEEDILRSLGAVVEATLLRVLNREEADIARALDQALHESLRATELSEALDTYIKQAAEPFKVEAGHIRLLKNVEDVLEMVAGTGDYYEAFKVIRRKTGLDSNSLTAEAFKIQKVVVANNAEEHPWQKWALKEYWDNSAARSALQKERSFASVPIYDDKSNPIGTISLVSHRPWFFTRPRVNALQALAQRVSYLIEHFKIQQDRQFLLEISSDFVRDADFVKPAETINETIKRFRKASNADIASLFIWDKEAERFVLRAQDGWADDEWVDAARYKKGECWTGSVALEKSPQYVPDLFAHKRKNRMSSADREYEIHRFGHPLSEYFTVEALGLPLRLKRDQTIGLLTLFRQINPDRPGSGFTTTDPRILQEAADTISSMLSALLYNLRMDWFKDEMKCHEAVRDALEKGNRHIPLEERLCRQMLESYADVQQVLFYVPSNRETKSGLRLAASLAGEGVATLASRPDEMVIKVAQQRRIHELRKMLSDMELKNPETAKMEGLVERVALPLQNGESLIGVLDLRFRKVGRQSHLVAQYDPDLLEDLARKIALVYQQQKELERKAEAEVQAEKGRRAVQAMGAMVFQTAHRLINLTQTIRSLSILIEAAESEAERRQKFLDLVKLVNSATEGIKRPMEIAKQMKQISLRPYNLESLLAEATLEADIQHHFSSVSIQSPLPDDITVLVDHALIIEAFRNIIHNAMKAMPHGGRFTVSTALSDDRRTAQVIFTDNGVGMSEEQIQAALSGFVTTQNSTGLGVLVSRLLISAQNGELEIKSKPGIGTEVTITLPADQHKETV